MPPSVSEPARDGRRYGVLLIALLVMFAVQPFFLRYGRGHVVAAVAWTWVLVSSTVAAGLARRWRVLTGALAVLTLVPTWLHVETFALRIVANLSGIAVLAIVVSGVLRHLLRTRDVTADTIYGSACVYLLACLVFALVFATIESLAPGSFQVAGQPLPEGDRGRLILTYFSMVTITTVGYGDVSAIDPAVGILAGLEAMLGQMYLAVLVARLVSLHASARREQAP